MTAPYLGPGQAATGRGRPGMTRLGSGGTPTSRTHAKFWKTLTIHMLPAVGWVQQTHDFAARCARSANAGRPLMRPSIHVGTGPDAAGLSTPRSRRWRPRHDHHV